MKSLSLALIVVSFSLNALAQQPRDLTTEDYAHAESLLSYNTQKYIDHPNVRANWISDDKFWYRDADSKGSEFILVDAAKGKRSGAFDQQKLAASLSAATGKTYQPEMLPFQSFSYSADGKSVHFRANGKQWNCDLKNYKCTRVNHNGEEETGFRFGGSQSISPDGKKEAFIKDYNLWVRDIASGKETPLTTDGEKYFGYATDNAGWKHSNAAIISWSPDSKKIATFQQDERKVGDMYLVTTNVGHPKLEAWKYPLPGDTNIIMIQRVVINVDAPKVIRLQVAPDPHRSSLGDDISTGNVLNDVDWNPNGNEFAFVSTSRDHKVEKFRIANTVTGAVREVFEETVPTQFESGQKEISWRYLPATNEIIWYSERDNWGHLYLYDATTGKLKNQITKGDYVVSELIKVDEKKREIYFMAVGKDPVNPYFAHFYKIGFDGENLVSLTPDNGNHSITLSPSQKYFIDNYSQLDVPAVFGLRDLNGKLKTILEKTDVSRLVATGWQPPKPITVKAHDGVTDLYGLMFTPTHLDPQKKYPVIDYIYPGPQSGSVGSWSFIASRGDNQALSELGFVVVLIEGTSNPLRTKSFHDMSYGHMSENTLPDQVSGIRQLAAKYSYMDTSRIGIWGHSGGGFATAAAMFRYPDFFKVGIAESGNHDNRNYEDDWGERYIGLLTIGSNGVSNYEPQANQIYAKNLKGKLMLAHGMVDDNVPPSNTMLVVEALEKANKDFDLVIFPNSRHGYGAYSAYMMRRRWDYFVTNLLGVQHPTEYEFGKLAGTRR
ncbi:MAG: DPP IV N-terminal domain-containing protein [Ginsengibacter sp.]